MPLSSVEFAPGVNAEVTETQGIAQIITSQLIRFKFAGNKVLPEKLGGWDKFYPLSLGSAPRDMHAWEDINTATHLAVGCESSLNVITSGAGADITPRTSTTNVTVDFSTTNGSATVTIVDADFATSIYTSIYILTPVAVGGLILLGEYAIASVLSSTSYTITAASNATSTVANGGAVPVFGTTNGSTSINVALTAHGQAVGDVFNIPASVATTVGGVTLSGAYLVQAIVNANNFTIYASTAATSTTTGSMNAGEVSTIYFVGIAPPPASAGYGTGTYGSGAYGLGVVPTSSTGSAITATNWTLDNWGDFLLACPANGPIYQWSPNSGYSTATKILNAPLINGGIFVSQPAQILVAWGSSIEGVQDPLLVSWSDAGDFLVWAATSQTQAGSYRIPTGSKIVGGLAGPNFGVIWTDIGVWAMDYVQPPLVFGFNSLGDNCGLISRHGAVSMGSRVYWMGQNQFYVLVGESVEVIPCTVWDVVFQDLDTDNVDKVYAGTNSLFNEVTFYYPSLSGGTGEVDSYAKLNTVLNVWDYGTLDRSAWIDQSPVGQPIGASPTGYIYQHEVSKNADGQPLISSFTTGFFTIADGEELTFVDLIMPDFKYGYNDGTQDANIDITLTYTDYPNGDQKSVGPYNVSDSTTYVNTRLRGRFMSLAVSSSDLDSFWRLGGLKFRSVGDGRR